MLRLAMPALAEELLVLRVTWTDWSLTGHYSQLDGDNSVAAMRLMGMPCLAVVMIFSGTRQGAGDSIPPMLFTEFGFFLIRIPLAAYLCFDELLFVSTAENDIVGLERCGVANFCFICVTRSSFLISFGYKQLFQFRVLTQLFRPKRTLTIDLQLHARINAETAAGFTRFYYLWIEGHNHEDAHCYFFCFAAGSLCERCQC